MNILILNLRRFGDLFYSGHVIAKLKTSFKNSSISFLAYEESARALNVFDDLENSFTIDRKKIGTLLKGGPFSLAHSFHEIKSVLGKVGTNWDLIVNLSNCETSAYLCSYLKNENTVVSGIHFNDNGTLISSNNWAIVWNELLPDFEVAPFSYYELYCKINGITAHDQVKCLSLKRSDKHEESSLSIFNTLNKFKEEEQIYTIGIQPFASSEEKSITFEQTKSILNSFLSHTNFYPVLLIAPSEKEREFAKKINFEFENSLLVIESDFVGLNSILNKLELLVTADTSVKHLASLNSLKVLEVSFDLKRSFLMPAPNSTIAYTSKEHSKIGSEICEISEHILFAKEINSKFSFIESIFEFSPLAGFILRYSNSSYSQNIFSYYLFNRATINFSVENKFNPILKSFSREFLAEFHENLSKVLSLYKNIKNCEKYSEEMIRNLNELSNREQSSSPFQIVLSICKSAFISALTDNTDVNFESYKTLLLHLKKTLSLMKNEIARNVQHEMHNTRDGENEI